MKCTKMINRIILPLKIGKKMCSKMTQPIMRTDNIIDIFDCNKDSFMINLPNQVRIIIQELKQAQNNDDIARVFYQLPDSLPDVWTESSTTLAYKGFNISNMLQIYSAAYIDKIKFLNKLKISSAPELIGCFNIDDTETIIATCYKNCRDVNPILLNTNDIKVSNDAKSQFIKDMHKLSKYNLGHVYAAKSSSYWYINPKTGSILLKDWGALQSVNEYEKRELLNGFKSILKDI